MENYTKQRILDVNIEDEMKKSYIDYAMSVIVGRALPDVRDGLKPVHRRILYAMSELGVTPDKPYRKSARIVGDVLGKYHPHGDTAVYEAMVRMAQDFSTRYTLVDGHGNFGSIDGDSPAAMRYTEARMSKIATEMMADIDKQTVDFMPNFDETLKEPVVLPSRFPNLLVNGSSGIAVGMATNIPPHNLVEVIDGVVKLIDDPDMSTEDLMEYIKGPDFPTGGIIIGRQGIRDAYQTGRGRIIVRAKVKIEQISPTKSSLIVTELPYQVNKSKLIEKIAELVRDKRIEGISDIRDETDKSGMRIVIELKRDVNPNIVLNLLYKHTQMQETFGVIMLALVNNEPKILTLKQAIFHYIDHQRDVIVRRTRYDLNKAQNRAHILEGLIIALDNLDTVINLIRSSKTVQVAKDGLIKKFNLSEKQAQAILDMRLQRLTGLERQKIEQEYDELLKTIKYLKDVLANDDMIYDIIKKELGELKRKYGDQRRTSISSDVGEIDIEDLIQEEEVVITFTHFGYIKRMPIDTYRIQKRGGKGIQGLQTREDDFVEKIFITSTHHYIMFFTNKGKVYRLKAYEIPEASRQARGTAIVNLLQLDSGEKITAAFAVKEFDDMHNLVLATEKGLIKKISLKDLDTNRRVGLIAITLRENDELISVQMTDGNDELIIGTRLGLAIRFSEKDVRVMGRTAQGVKAINLNKDDIVIGMGLVIPDGEVLVVTEKGYGKRTHMSEYRLQARGGKGIITSNITEKTGELVSIKVVRGDEDVMLINSDGTIIRLGIDNIPVIGRNTQGVTLMRLDEGHSVVSVALVDKNGE
ncbi:MAG TPA: DNA gyrase subunit A [Clostridiales bacterium]|nr:DNA gyrase subunit A [Clostridiales bacterium]